MHIIEYSRLGPWSLELHMGDPPPLPMQVKGNYLYERLPSPPPPPPPPTKCR